MEDYYSLKEMLNTTDASVSVVNHNVKKYSHIVLINSEWNAKILIPIKIYKNVSISNNCVYIKTKKKIFVKGLNIKVDEFEVDLSDEKSDILGFLRLDSVFKKFSKYELNCSDRLIYKVIFSPQLANWLLKRGYKIVELKQRKGTNDTLFVFVIEEGFFKSVEEFKRNTINE